MNFLSVCSGIEAASVAWKDLGWKALGLSEIEPFPSAVLAHHYPDVINYGDINGHSEWNLPPINLLVGGTPCQSFSIAGLRKGLADPRGNIMLTYLRIIESRKPRWIIWENVPGVLSSNGGRDFSTFVTSLGNMGYGWAYRVLDAQWFGVAQRRRRVFVVGYLGDASRAAKVLFERESVCRNPAPSREKGQRIADTLTVGANQCSGFHGDFVEAESRHGVATNVAACLRSGGAGGVPSSRGEHLVATRMVAFGEYANDGTASALKMRDYKDATDLVAIAFEPGIAGREGNESRFTHEVTGTLRKDMGDNQTAIAFSFDSLSSNSMKSKNPVSGCNQVEVSKALDTSRGLDPSCNQGGMAVAFHPTQDPISSENISHALGTGSKSGNATSAVMQSTAVRRLTPTECERLQGFPDGYTAIPWKKKTADQCPDGPRYKALGNSMAVPVMGWIGKRINNVNKNLNS